MRSRAYLRLLLLAAVLGVPVSAVSWGFLALASKLERWLYASLPSGLGLKPVPLWWPFPLLALAGFLVALIIRYLPGTAGHSPADGFQAGGVFGASEIPGIALAALVTLGFGAVLGPEAPLIALGGALSAWAVSRARAADASRVKVVVAAAGGFAAISTLLGSPIVGAFLLMEAAGLGGATMTLVLLPGLLAAGIGALIFDGLGTWSGLGTFSLAVPGLPHFARPDVAEFGWALAIGVVAAVVCEGIRRGALALREVVQRQPLIWTPVAGLVVAGLAAAFGAGTGRDAETVLFSGQDSLAPFIRHAAAYGLGALVLLVACKAIGYSVSMSGFRGGPTFPAIFIGAVGGAALAHLPGLSLVPAIGMGIGAMAVGMLRLPLTSVLLASILLFSDGVAIMPLVIVAVTVAYVTALRLDSASAPSGQPPSGRLRPRPGRGSPGAGAGGPAAGVAPAPSLPGAG